MRAAARRCSTFFGTPAVALLIAVLLAFYLLGVRRGMRTSQELGKS